MTRDQFLARVEVGGPNECWVWNGPGDYGAARFEGRVWRANQLMFFFVHGRLAKDCVLHSCDNPKCVNPSHLFEGTRLDNNRDMISKGRQAKRRPKLVGNKNRPPVLDAETLADIEYLLVNGESTRNLSKEYSVSRGVIIKVKRGTYCLQRAS